MPAVKLRKIVRSHDPDKVQAGCTAATGLGSARNMGRVGAGCEGWAGLTGQQLADRLMGDAQQRADVSMGEPLLVKMSRGLA